MTLSETDGGAPAPATTQRSVSRWLWPDRFRPWSAPATAGDRVLMGSFLGVVVLGFALRPLKPLLLASHPVALEFASGDLLAIGAAAAFARIGEAPLWMVVIAGALGMAKFDWLLWWAGRQWGEGMIRMIAAPEQAHRYATRAAALNPWVLRAAVVAAVLPGAPTPILYVLAGIGGMRFATFLALNICGTLLLTGVVVAVGYRLGQHAVNLVLLIDRYASWVSIGLIGVAFLAPWLRRRWNTRAKRGSTWRDGDDGRRSDA